jgi:hypothetical protein
LLNSINNELIIFLLKTEFYINILK